MRQTHNSEAGVEDPMPTMSLNAADASELWIR